MDSKNGQNGQNGGRGATGLFSFLGEITEEKKSGLVYTFAAAAVILCSFLFILVIGAAGLAKEGYNSSQWYLYCSYALSPLAFALVAAGYFFKTKTSVKTMLCPPSGDRLKIKYFFIALLMQAGLLSLSQANSLFLKFLGSFGYQSSEILLPSLSGGGVIGVLLVVAVLPAIFEELIFRGLLLKGLRPFGDVAAVLICGALFALYHQNPAQTVYQFFCGVAYALVALKAGSILPTVLSHFLNNALIILLQKFGITSFSLSVTVVVTALSAVCLVGAVFSLVYPFGKKKTDAPATVVNDVTATSSKADKKGFWLCAAVGIVVFAASWISVLVSGI